MKAIRPRPPRAPDFQLTLTRAMLETLELKRILYVILSGITAGDGLGFNRAFLLLTDEGDRVLQGQLAVGPETRAEAHRIWEEMEEQAFDLDRLMQSYDAFVPDERASALTRQLQRVSLSLPLPETGRGFPALLGRVLTGKRSVRRNGRSLRVPDTSITLKNYAASPLCVADQAIGVLLVDNPYNELPVQAREMHDLRSVANLAAIAVERARLHERIRQMAAIDGLTGLLNRRRFDELYPQAFAACQTHGEPLAVILLDLDQFKAVNDQSGHLAGDDLLRGIAKVVLDRVRRGDLAARYGGDELIVALPRATADEALAIAEHFRRTVASRAFGPDRSIRSTVSIGVAALKPAHDSPEALVAAADEALYQAKAAGRNRVAALR